MRSRPLDDLAALTNGELDAAMTAGYITSLEFRDELHRRVTERFGGVNPYDDLRSFDDWEVPH